MKALVYHGPRDVQIDNKPRPNIQNTHDVILRVTSTALCGSDLHLLSWYYKEWNQDKL
jgi:S-(hydroxymethyl)glutathione dehydrogenase / alcohol dehydrogenase